MPSFNPPLVPISLKKTGDRCIIIEWSDETLQQIPFRVLREACRCAVCNAKRESELRKPAPKGELRVLSAAETAPLEVLKMHPVGNYAYNIHFSDGHSTGIYTFEMLRALGNV